MPYRSKKAVYIVANEEAFSSAGKAVRSIKKRFPDLEVGISPAINGRFPCVEDLSVKALEKQLHDEGVLKLWHWSLTNTFVTVKKYEVK